MEISCWFVNCLTVCDCDWINFWWWWWEQVGYYVLEFLTRSLWRWSNWVVKTTKPLASFLLGHLLLGVPSLCSNLFGPVASVGSGHCRFPHRRFRWGWRLWAVESRCFPPVGCWWLTFVAGLLVVAAVKIVKFCSETTTGRIDLRYWQYTAWTLLIHHHVFLGSSVFWKYIGPT